MREIVSPLSGIRSPFGQLTSPLAIYAVLGIKPELVLDFDADKYFVNSERSTFSDSITHSASSNATMVDSDGLLKWRPHNLLPYSEDLTQWSSTNITVSSGVADPDGGNSAFTLTADTLASFMEHRQNVTFPAETQITYRVKMRSVGVSSVVLRLRDAATQSNRMDASCNLSAGSVTATSSGTFSNASASLADIGGGWYECVFVGTTGTSTSLRADFLVTSSAVVGTGDFSVYQPHLHRSDLGGMVNNPDRGDSYVPTTSSAVYLPRRGHHVYNGTSWVNEGLLHESEARTNLVLYNVGPDINSTNWTEDGTATVTPNAATVAGISASLVDIGSAGSGLGPDRISQNISVSDSTQHVVYAIVKTLDAENINMRAFTTGGAVTDPYIEFNFATQEVTARTGDVVDSSGYLALGDGAYLVWFTFTPDAGDTNCSLRLGGPIFGTNTGEQFYVAAMQLVEGHSVTSLIPTSGAAATRAKDEPSRDIPEGFIQGEGSIYFEGSIDYETGGSGFPRVFQMDNGSNADRIVLVVRESTEQIFFSTVNNNVGQGAIGFNTVASGEVITAAMRFADDDFASSIEGSSAATDASGTVPTNTTTLRIGDIYGVTDTVRIRDFRLFPYSSLAATPGWSDATLETISGA